MKQIKILLGLILLASVSTFAQSPRIKLNQITKDSLVGSVLISSPTDSGMVYSRELFIYYGADTVLILNGDTLAATSGIISSVLSDGVTVLGNGTTGDELRLDTFVIATINALNDSLAGISTEIPVDTFVTIAGTETITGAKTFTAALNQSGGDVNFDSGTLFVDESANRVGIGTTSPISGPQLHVSGASARLYLLNNSSDSVTNFSQLVFGNGVINGEYAELYRQNDTKQFLIFNHNGDIFFSTKYANGYNYDIFIESDNGNVGIGTATPSYKLHVNGSVAGVGAYNNLSDVNYKKNINDLKLGLGIVNQLRPITYNWINEEYGTRTNIGFIAQEIEAVLPNIVTTSDDNVKSMATTDLIPILTKAIQEQQTEIDQIKTLIQSLITRIENLENN